MASTEKSINYTMRLFSACAIVLVVVGHIPSTGFNGPFDMFKPYSFQVEMCIRDSPSADHRNARHFYSGYLVLYG